MSRSFLNVDTPQVVVTAVKNAEDNDGVIIRAYESHNQPVSATIEFMGTQIRASFGAAEIKTFKIPYGGGSFVETDLLEW